MSENAVRTCSLLVE